MLSLTKILVPYDFSVFSQMALRQAARLARLYDAALHVLHVEALHEIPVLDQATGAERAEQLRRRIAGEHSDEPDLLRDIVVHYAVSYDFSPGPSILQYASQYDVDLIVAGTHGRRGIGRVFLGSVAEEIVRLADCPVMTVRENESSDIHFESLERILVPIDFSVHSEDALRYAHEIARESGAQLDLLHVVPVNAYPSMNDTGAFAMYAEQPGDVEGKAMEHLEKLYSRIIGAAGNVRFHILHGTGAHEIVEQAIEMKSNLIVIGTHGLTGIERFMLGSVTAKTLRRAPCPVFVVKSFGKSLLESIDDATASVVAE